MIASIFSKSKSINFVVVFLVTLLAFIKARFIESLEPISALFVAKQMLCLVVCYATIFLLNFIISKNSLTKLNSYEIVLFSLFLLLIPSSTLSLNVLFANFFVLLGLRRIMSLRTERNEKKKLFDAAFWIAIASIFFFWSILFFVLILVALALYANKNIRFWIIPFIGLATVFIIATTTSLILYDSFSEFTSFSPGFSYDFSSYNSFRFIIGITVLLSFGTWSAIFYLQNIKKQKMTYRTSFKIVIIAWVIAVFLVFQAPNKNGGEFLFLFAPLTIIVTNYLETVNEKWFKEVFLGVLIVTPLVLLLL